jgi:hypothetical protein
MKLITNQQTITTEEVKDLRKKYIALKGRDGENNEIRLFLVEVETDVYTICSIEFNRICFYIEGHYELEQIHNVICDAVLYSFDNAIDLLNWLKEEFDE